MKLLLDTHALLWWRMDDPRLPRRLDDLLGARSDGVILVSVVTLWEIAIKRSLGKLTLEGGVTDFARQLEDEHGFTLLPLEPAAVDRLEKLPHHHGDPFDRLLIAQALEEGAAVVTNDRNWKKYPCKIRW